MNERNMSGTIEEEKALGKGQFSYSESPFDFGIYISRVEM